MQTEKFRQIGGKGVGSSLRKCLKTLATDEVLLNYSWAGLSEKLKFKDLKNILDCLYASIIKNNPEATQTEIKADIQNWLKHAKERIALHSKNINMN